MEVYIASWTSYNDDDGVLGVYSDFQKAKKFVIEDIKDYLNEDWDSGLFSCYSYSNKKHWVFSVRNCDTEWHIDEEEVQ